LGQIATPACLVALRERLEIEQDSEVREEIEEAIGGRRQAEDSVE
jgi:hypothetical protein